LPTVSGEPDVRHDHQTRAGLAREFRECSIGLALRAAKSDLVQPELKLENQVGERVA